MAKIKIDDLLLVLQQMKFDGYDTVNILEFEAENDVPASISLSCEDGMYDVDYEYIFDADDPDNVGLNISEYSTYIPNELEVICCALDISHQYFKQHLNDSSLSADERSETSKMLKTHEALFNVFLQIVN